MPDAISRSSNGSAKLPSSRPETGASHVPDAAWQQQLVQKDELIQALTEQLEQAAEQLDRLQRTGNTRGRPGAAVPEEQRKAFEDLQRVVQQWEDMQAGLTLGRIELQITELRDLILDQQTAPAHYSSSSGQDHRNQHDSDDRQESPSVLSFADLVKEQKPSEPASEWERMKSQLLAGEESSNAATENSWEALEQPLPEPPAAVDPAHQVAADLHTAIIERDDYIRMLLTRLRRIEVLQPAAALSALEPESTEFLGKVQVLEQRLLEHARCAEVELSVERAKLARERAHLSQQQELIERQLKKLGLSSVDELNQLEAPAGTLQERRWSRFLGRPRQE
ncbi:hypothetical protein GC163_00820 [bacterium]|nr:hypothetical protein [bacterium]